MVAAALRQADLHVAVLQLPFIILLQQHRTDQPDDRCLVGKDFNHVATSLHFLVQSLQRVCAVLLGPLPQLIAPRDATSGWPAHEAMAELLAPARDRRMTARSAPRFAAAREPGCPVLSALLLSAAATAMCTADHPECIPAVLRQLPVAARLLLSKTSAACARSTCPWLAPICACWTAICASSMFCTLVAARLLAAATPTVSQHRDPACSGGPEPETSAQSYRTKAFADRVPRDIGAPGNLRISSGEGRSGACPHSRCCRGEENQLTPVAVCHRSIRSQLACPGCDLPRWYGAVADQGLGRMEEATNLCLCIPRSSPVSPARRGQHLTDRPPECPSGDTGDRSAELIQVSRCGVATAHTNYPLHLNASLN